MSYFQVMLAIPKNPITRSWFFSFMNEDEHDFMHGESLGDFLILLEPWTVVNSVDTGVAVVRWWWLVSPHLV